MKTRLNVSTGLLLVVELLCTPDVSSRTSDAYLNDSLPDTWSTIHNESYAPLTNEHWWSCFDDAVLDSLIEKGLSNNYDVALGARRIQIAKYTLRNAKAGYFPQLDFNGSWIKQRNSGTSTGTLMPASNESYWDLELSFSWQVDLFGKIKSQVGRAGKQFKATKAEYDAMMLTVASEIASTYIQLRVYQSELLVAEEHAKNQNRVLKITEARFETELGNMLDVTQARQVYYSTISSIPVLKASIEKSINALAVLLGEYPQQLRNRIITPTPLPDCHILIPSTIPADILRNRPDIVASELQLASYADALGIAKKDFLPTLTINGAIGTMSHDAKNLFDKRSITYNIGPSLSWTLFDGLSRHNNVVIAKEQLNVAIDNYNQAVLSAYQDVENSMLSYKSALEYIDAIQKLVNESAKALNLSLDLYRSSLTQFSNVVDAQMSLLENQNSLIVAQGNALKSAVSIFESLGGGWNGNF